MVAVEKRGEMEDNLNASIWFTKPEYEEIYRISGKMTDKSGGFDLVNVEPVYLVKPNTPILINLGIVIKVPTGYESILLPRSSTYRNFGIMQTNSIGLIDEDYCGPEDVWMMPVTWSGHFPGKKSTVIPSGTRICQFFLRKKIPFNVVVSEKPFEKNRGGFGSTGV
jgi:dUTP pyrophosphatase